MSYTSERNHQIVIELLKYHNIKKIIASPGATNVSFIASIQNDPFFEIYSSVDERSAAYIACGMAAESGEVVVLSCTGATASRNYLPGLTEAFYRKLPILAITSSMPITGIGHNIPQLIDRTNTINDVAKLSVHIPMVKNSDDEWSCTIKANEAMLELKHRTTGPVHINLETLQGGTFDVKTIDYVRPIDRIMYYDELPSLSGNSIAIFVGSHVKWNKSLTDSVDLFCEKYNSVVLVDHTSNYKGKYGILASLITSQKGHQAKCINMDVLLHIGDVSGAYLKLNPKQTWRINPDGALCDTFKKLRYTFEMGEKEFFEKYNSLKTEKSSMTYFEKWKSEYSRLFNKIDSLPFSNIWISMKISQSLPEHSVLHLGILNSLRSWNFFEIPTSVAVYSNTGGFGIDGCISSALGASLAAPSKIFFCVVGDLSFFYDMNALGNRHFGNNVRLLVINNGHGQEFRNPGHRASQFGEDTDKFIAAAGHYGNKSDTLIKNYVMSLGFKYLCANDKESFLNNIEEFTSEQQFNAPIVFEVFTENEDEAAALSNMTTMDEQSSRNPKQIVKNIIGDKGVDALNKFLKR